MRPAAAFASGGAFRALDTAGPLFALDVDPRIGDKPDLKGLRDG